MKPTSKELIEAISSHCSNQITLYKFNTSTLQITDKYREGRLTALEYIGELTFYYLQKEKNLQQEFHEQILRQMEQFSCLDDTEYKQGIYDALNSILDYKRDFIEKEEPTPKKKTQFAQN
jgi:hypothetical protein